MSSPVYNVFGNSSNGASKENPITNIMQQFERFKSSFTGDARQQVQQLLNSGKVSQSDYNRAVQLANKFQQILKR